MIERTDYNQIPNYLKAVTILEPEGSAPAEVAAELDKWRASREAHHSGIPPPQDRLTQYSASGSIDVAPIGRFALAAVLSFLGLIFVFAGLTGPDTERAFMFGIPCLALAYWLFTKNKQHEYLKILKECWGNDHREMNASCANCGPPS